MYLLGVKKVQICPFKGTAPGTSCCTQKGTILNPYFSVCSCLRLWFMTGFQHKPYQNYFILLFFFQVFVSVLINSFPLMYGLL